MQIHVADSSIHFVEIRFVTIAVRKFWIVCLADVFDGARGGALAPHAAAPSKKKSAKQWRGIPRGPLPLKIYRDLNII